MADDNGMVQPRTGPGVTGVQHQREFMEAIAKEVSKEGDVVLKGGGALLFGYGLNRFSDDLDFDSKRAPELEKSFKNAAKSVNVEIENIRIRKDTDTVKRYKVDYAVLGEDGGPAETYTLKVEVSMRNKEFGPQDTRTVNGISVYTVEQLISQKLKAFENRTIPRARDLNDMVFLTENYSDHFNQEQTDKLKSLIRDPDELAFKFGSDHSRNMDKLPPLDDLILRLDMATQEIAEKLERQDRGKDGHERTADHVSGISDGRPSETVGRVDRTGEGEIKRAGRDGERTRGSGAGISTNARNEDKGDREGELLRAIQSDQVKARQELRAQDSMMEATQGSGAYQQLAKEKAVSVERQVDRSMAKAERIMTSARKEAQALESKRPGRMKQILKPKERTQWQAQLNRAKRRAARAERVIKECNGLKRDANKMKQRIQRAINKEATPEMLVEKKRLEEEQEKKLAEKRREEEAKRLEKTKDMVRRLEAERERDKQKNRGLGLGRDRNLPNP